MKKLFLLCLAFCALAVCNCKHDVSPGHVLTTSETGQEEITQKPETPPIIPPIVVPPETISNEQGESAATGGVSNEEEETPEDETEEVVTPEDGTETISNEQLEMSNEEEETQEEGTPEDETQEDGEPEGGKPVVEMPELALLQINELKTEFSSAMKSAEYIEFRAIKGGSLEGLYLYIMINAQDTFVYIFPEIDVETGEYITLHLRTLDKNNCWDELRDDLTLSGGMDACPTARDLWVSGNDKLLDKSSIVYLQDYYGKIMDAVVMKETQGEKWNNNQANFAERIYKAGMWLSVDAVTTSAIGLSPYKSISRYENRENTHSAKDWYITAAGYLTPGTPNK